ncbi:MAG TPA: hypothetical protein VM051_11560 [Usitatibacter sp.]|nr:hypothetical protein [Usitatibacter sp.]
MKKNFRLFAAVALGLPTLALAGPSDYVYTPSVEYGERELDVKYGTEKMKASAGGERTSVGSFGVGYGATEWWFTEAYLKWHKEGSDKSKYDAFEWENKFQLTESNKYFVDVGFITEFEVPRERHIEGYEFKFGPLFQFDTGPLRWNANLLFERMFRSHEEGAHPWEMGYQLQAAYRLRSGIDVGVQAFGEMGKWNQWEPRDEQLHRIGPAVFGKVKLGEGRQAIKYNAAFLFGETPATPRHTFRLQAEYEF